MVIPSRREELVHAITHAGGVILGAVVLTAMIGKTLGSDWVALAAVSVYGASLTLLFAASTAFHAVHEGPLKKRFQKADHCAIHLLIAGTYTPYAIVALHGWVGTTLLITVWALAFLGIGLEWLLVPRRERLSVALYLTMGWLALFVAVPLANALSVASMALLIAGGLLYTVGVPFYMRNRRWDHAIWHGFVLAGAGTHGLAVLSFL
jgi:hemolysin III